MFICPTLPAADARALVGRCASQERLVSLIQAQVLALMSRDHLQELAHPTEAEAVQLVRAGLYLLLEIGQRVSMQQVHLAARRPPSPAARPHPPSACPRACQRARGPGPPLPACSARRAQILVGSWSADLLTSTGHLVRCEVHPDLRPLVLPAKMLQNTLARGPPAPARSN